MYRGYFNQMGLGPNQLMASLEPLYGFTGDVVIPVGCIRLPLMVGDPNRQSTVMADFLIIDNLSAYVIMGRPTMNDLNLVVSTRALAMKFLTHHDRMRKRRAVFGKALLRGGAEDRAQREESKYSFWGGEGNASQQ